MNAPLASPLKFDVLGLMQVMAMNEGRDAPCFTMSTQQWELLASYMQPITLNQGQILIRQGAEDRTVYLVEEGSLSVHYEDDKGRLRLAIIGPGSVVGEGSFFNHQPRSATVQAATPGKVWSLAPVRFAELGNRQPQVALQLAMGLGAVVAKRLVYRPKRIAVT
jgi:CRP/FNR family cyclic AMP-dependent transcriptional regulator